VGRDRRNCREHAERSGSEPHEIGFPSAKSNLHVPISQATFTQDARAAIGSGPERIQNRQAQDASHSPLSAELCKVRTLSALVCSKTTSALRVSGAPATVTELVLSMLYGGTGWTAAYEHRDRGPRVTWPNTDRLRAGRQ
jgi:hypothetical protein